MTEQKKRILFVNDEMRMGGVARVLNTLMASLPADCYEIDLLILHKRGMLLDEVPANVRVLEGTPFFKPVDESLWLLLRTGDIGGLFSKLRLLFFMKTGLIKARIRKERAKIIDRPYDIEVAAKEGFCTIFTACGDSRRKINWVLTDYSECNYSKWHMPLVKWALQYIDLNVADSRQAMDAYEKVFGVSNGITIHNLMNTENVKKCAQEPAPEIADNGMPSIITVARFHPQKSIDRLLTASSEAYRAGYRHTLYLIGGGEQEGRLRQQAEAAGMKHVVFLGYKQNPYADMAKCDLFVLPSLYEGFATVISESLIVGTPVLTTKVSGTEEQIIAPEDGWIVENSQQGLNEGLKNALSDPLRLQAMKNKLSQYHYPNEKILKQFMEIF
jgi:glycosyltransferase involved in cell wall biosynthesis